MEIFEKSQQTQVMTEADCDCFDVDFNSPWGTGLITGDNFPRTGLHVISEILIS